MKQNRPTCRRIVFQPFFVVLAVAILAIALGGCQKPVADTYSDNKPLVAVAIPPLETFVQEVGDDQIQTVSMIPQNASPVDYELTDEEKELLAKADIYFSIGVPTEAANIIPYLGTDTLVVDLGSEVAERYPELMIDEERDPHIWLSPRRAVVMVEIIAQEISDIDPENSDQYTENAAAYVKKLNDLQQKLANIFQESATDKLIVVHPFLSYFADDYGLEMYALEINGKEATAQHLQEMLDLAVAEEIDRIFYQLQFSSDQARAFADAIQGEAVVLNPLAPNYIENMENMALAISREKEKENEDEETDPIP